MTSWAMMQGKKLEKLKISKAFFNNLGEIPMKTLWTYLMSTLVGITPYLSLWTRTSLTRRSTSPPEKKRIAVIFNLKLMKALHPSKTHHAAFRAWIFKCNASYIDLIKMKLGILKRYWDPVQWQTFVRPQQKLSLTQHLLSTRHKNNELLQSKFKTLP